MKAIGCPSLVIGESDRQGGPIRRRVQPRLDRQHRAPFRPTGGRRDPNPDESNLAASHWATGCRHGDLIAALDNTG